MATTHICSFKPQPVFYHPFGPSPTPILMESQVSLTLLWVSLLWMKYSQAMIILGLNSTANSKQGQSGSE